MGGTEGNWGPGIIGLAATCEALVLIFTFLRIYTRVWIVRGFWWDDFTMILAVLGTTIGCSLCFVEVHFGFGKHFQYLNEHQQREFRKYTFGEWIQTFATLMWTKISICLFLIRIANNRTLRTAMYWGVGFLLFSNTILTTMWIMSCQPVHTQWYGQGICMSRFEKEAIIMTQAIISIVSDFVFAAFPIFYFWRLQVDLKTKIGLWLLMCLGVITGVCCIVRTVLNGDSIPDDETYDGIVNWTWRLFEVQFGIIAACIPTLRPLYSCCVARVKGERVPFSDGNIKFLHSEKEQAHRWVEDKPASSSRHHNPFKHHHHRSPSPHLEEGLNGSAHKDQAPNGPTERGRKHTVRFPLHFSHSPSGHHGGSQNNEPAPPPRHAEDMRQDLVNEGIVKSNAHSGTAGRDRSIERHTSSAGLQNDMHKYGIPDEFSSQENSTHPTPNLRQQQGEFEKKIDRAEPWGQEEQHPNGVLDDDGTFRELASDAEHPRPNSSKSSKSYDAGSTGSGSGRSGGLQEALESDDLGLGPMATAHEWEPGPAN